ncbi:hypothetical protein K3722_04160 [Leisingera caerulea]|uniref:Uncharacterized protein n=1 Tax=Leisingera caerulea TaxID=506591 RepID=A0ABY5WYD0_LEICA|nr:hypothetical protein [Leisingera caerulea]UWQ59329.1 hypothetical protein K3722_04160 [Leisingera caerulea]
MIPPKIKAAIDKSSDPEQLQRFLNAAEKNGNAEMSEYVRRRIVLVTNTIDSAFERCVVALKRARGDNRLGRLPGMVKNHGKIETIVRLVSAPTPSEAFHVLVSAGDYRHTFEHIVAVEFPDRFDQVLVEHSRQRLIDAGVNL